MASSAVADPSLRAGQAPPAKPDEWIDQLTIAGTPQDWQAAIDRFVQLGAHSVVLVPLPDTGLDEVEKFGRHLLL